MHQNKIAYEIAAKLAFSTGEHRSSQRRPAMLIEVNLEAIFSRAIEENYCTNHDFPTAILMKIILINPKK
jgi:hypothetical protein